VTSRPSDADQDETERIVTEAVESGASPREPVANESGGGPNIPTLPPTEPFTADTAGERDSEMHQP
jgi:N utilization substance protein A